MPPSSALARGNPPRQILASRGSVRQCGREGPPSRRAIPPRAANPQHGLGGIGRILQGDHAGVEEKPAVAVFGQAGEPVDLDHGEACPFERLDQGIGEPLRQLVEGNEPLRGIRRLDERVAPGIAEIDAAEGDAARPDRAEMGEQSLQDRGRLDAVVFGGRRDDVEEPAGPRIVMLPEDVGVRRDDAAEAVEKRRAALEADERIVGRDLEACGEILRRQGHQHIRIDAEGVLGPARKGAAHEHVEARHGQALGADIGFAGAAFLVAPLRPGARIEQHGDDGEIEGGAGHVGRRSPTARRASPRPSGHGRRQRNGASGHGTGCRERDRPPGSSSPPRRRRARAGRDRP